MVVDMKVKKGLKFVGKVVLGVVLVAVLLWVGSTIGESIFKARYFKSLDDFEFLVVEENPVCPLCERAPTNPPLLVNANEGSVSELRIYDTYPTYPLQIRAKEEYGVFWTLGGKGWSGGAFPDNDYAHFSIQRKRMFNYNASAARYFFCNDCMGALNDLDPSCNFVIVDAYEKDNLKFYDIADIEDVAIRHYSFVIEEKGYDLFSVELHSSYREGGDELDYLNKDTAELEKFYDHQREVIEKHNP